VVVSNIFYFHPYLGKIPSLTSIFFRWVGSTTNQGIRTGHWKKYTGDVKTQKTRNLQHPLFSMVVTIPNLYHGKMVGTHHFHPLNNGWKWGAR